MAAPPSLYNEERNLQRIRERERRNLEAQPEREPYLENGPLFGEPYKTNKGDELSSRIQRMLGNYEDVRELAGNNYRQNVIDSSSRLHTPTSYNPPSSMDKTQLTSNLRVSQAETPSNSASRPRKTLSATECSQLSSSCSSLSQGPGQSSPDSLQSLDWPELQECTSLPPMLSALSPPAEPLSPLHSSDSSDSESQDTDGRDTPPGNRSSLRQCRYSSLKDESNFEPQKGIPAQVQEAGSQPPQTFPPPLHSKPSLVMPQKPTAYVRPMDGQDQVPFESPDLKHSPEGFHRQSYENLSDLKSSTKPGFSKLKTSPHSEETSNDVHCVEDILREMTHTWPPPLTAIHTPSMPEPPKFSLAKEPQNVNSSISGQNDQYESPKALHCHPGSLATQASVTSTHPRFGKSSNSTDSESTSASDSDSDSSESDREVVPPPKRNNPPVSRDDAPVADKWQLDNWLVKAKQQSSTAGSLVDTLQSLSPTISKRQEVESYRNVYISQTPSVHSEFIKNDAMAAQATLDCQLSPQKSPLQADSCNLRRSVGSKHPAKASKALCPEGVQAQCMPDAAEVPSCDKSQTLTDRKKVKMKIVYEKSEPKMDTKKTDKHTSKKKLIQSVPKAILKLEQKMEANAGQPPSPEETPPVRLDSLNLEKCKKGSKKSCNSVGEGEQAPLLKALQSSPCSLTVKIDLRLLSRVPQPGGYRIMNSHSEPVATPMPKKKKKTKKSDAGGIPYKESTKRPAERDEENPQRKKHKLNKDIKPFPSGHNSNSAKEPKSMEQKKEKKKLKKMKSLPEEAAPQELKKEPKNKRQENGGLGGANANQDSSQPSAKHRKKRKKSMDMEQEKPSKKSTENCIPYPVMVQRVQTAFPQRPLLKFPERQFPVEYHMKEAKKLKHKADATMDKSGKAFNYLDAAMSFVESGIAMETDPQTPKSAYTMFSETVDLIRFILKLKNCVDPSGPASERDFTILCLRCQSLLQMAMFRHKREAALKYSRTLTEHFKNSRFAKTPSPGLSKSMGTISMSPSPSPSTSGNCSSAGIITIPQVIQQVAASYVNITALFLNAQDTWEQAEALTKRGSGLLVDLDAALGPLTLTSSMSMLVRHTRQALHWLRLETS